MPENRPDRLPEARGTLSQLAIAVDGAALRAFCDRWEVSAFGVFGSVLREDFGPDSDVDVIVEFQESARHTLRDLATMREELESIFGRPVDLVTRRGLEASRNSVRRESILSQAVLLDVA
jgi:predicted nucleotidyltransferase